MSQREETLALVRELATLGVSRATFGPQGELFSVEFGRSEPAAPVAVEAAEPESETPDGITAAALKLMGRGKR